MTSTKLRGVPGQRINEARLEFSDGSALELHTDAKGDCDVRFPGRSVRWVRLVVVDVDRTQASVALSSWSLGRSASVSSAKGSAALKVTSVRPSSGSVRGTRWNALHADAQQWLRVGFAKPSQVSAVRVEGGAATSSSSVSDGYLLFSDGSRVLVGALEPLGGAPTTVAFTPRMATWVKYVVTAVRGGAKASVKSLTVYPVGVVPPSGAAVAPGYRGTVNRASRCEGVRASAPTDSLTLLCPTNGSGANGAMRLVVSGPAGARLEVSGWVPRGAGGSVQPLAVGRVDGTGTGVVALPLRRMTSGPTAVKIVAGGVGRPLYVQLVNGSGVRQARATTALTRGMDLKLDEEFNGALSTSRTGAGATYASGKPNSYGVDDFGEAIFAQPNGSKDSMATIPGGSLRITARALGAGEKDPAPYGRRATSGLISSGHMGASGFSAQYGYFEARMLAPAGNGTWPAFWMLSSGSLVSGKGTGEIDAAELYGDAPTAVYQTTHSWADHQQALNQPVFSRIPPSRDWALSWHTYGALVLPDRVVYTVDGKVTGSTSATLNQSEPFFFLADLALEAGWQDGLAGVGHRASLYIDYIKVWV